MPYRQVIEQRLRFLEVTPATTDCMRQLKRALEREIDDVLDRFYAHLLQEPKLQRLFPDEETVARARAAQKRYWLDYLFASTFGKEHFEQAERIAAAHLRGGLELSWYMGGYCYVLNQFVALARSSDGGDPETLCREIQELNKLVFLDMATVTDMYLEAKNETMRELLRRATVFAEDMTALSQELADAHHDLETKLDAVAAGPELRESAARLSARAENLAARLADFRSGDKLHTAHHQNT